MPKKNIDLSRASEEELLDFRICDLELSIKGTWLEECTNQLYEELEGKGLRFKPPCYLADEWLAPDQEPIIGLPFFLAHPALIKMEQKMMLDVEGGTKIACMKLLRHESGHAINYAYKLYKKKKWQRIFGKFSEEYPDTYKFRPYSKNYVRHLESFYAQYHPDEDFSETFAVWMTPGLDWSNKYKGWKALEKLNYVDKLMKEIKDEEPDVKTGRPYWKASSLRITLKNYYKKRRHFLAEDFPDFHDFNLKKIFSENPAEEGKFPLASDIIGKYRRNIMRTVAVWTGEKKYIINDLLKAITKRCRALKLSVIESETLAVLRIATYITTLVMNYSHTGWFRGKK